MQCNKFSEINWASVKDRSSSADEAESLQAELSWLCMYALDCIHSNPDISPWDVKVMKTQQSSPQRSA